MERIAMSADANSPLAPTPEESTALVGAGLHIKGKISGNEDLHVDGNIEGSIQLEDRKLTIGANAKVKADVVAREVVVYGSVVGNVRASDRLEIKKDGSIVGELTTGRIVIEDGAHFKGSVEIERKAVDILPELDKPAYARAATATANPNTTRSN
jgi:cytoskeletal protein CcmA (bactofilin family)